MTARYNFEKPPKNVAFRSTSCMQCGPNSGSPNSESSMPNGRWRAPHDDWPVRAERGGFEPPRPVSQSNGLANRRYRPLSHLSLIAARRPDRGAKVRFKGSYQIGHGIVNRATGAVRRRTRD